MVKYLVASSGDHLDSKISGRFGHAKYFIVIDPQSMNYEVFPGVQPKEKMPGIESFMKFGINKVIVGNMGPSAFNKATRYGLSVYLCRQMTIREAVKKVHNEEIPPLKEPTLKESIHSPRKDSGKENELDKGRGMGLGRGRGKSTGRGPWRKG